MFTHSELDSLHPLIAALEETGRLLEEGSMQAVADHFREFERTWYYEQPWPDQARYLWRVRVCGEPMLDAMTAIEAARKSA